MDDRDSELGTVEFIANQTIRLNCIYDGGKAQQRVRAVGDQLELYNCGHMTTAINRAQARVLAAWLTEWCNRTNTPAELALEGYTVPRYSRAVVERWKLSSNPIQLWVTERTESVDRASVSGKEAYASYKSWAQSEGHPIPTLGRFCRALGQVVPKGKVNGLQRYALRLL